MSKVTVGVVANSKLIGSLLQELNPIELVDYEAIEGRTFKRDFLINTTNEELEYLYKGKEVSNIEFFIELKKQVSKIKEEEKEMSKVTDEQLKAVLDEVADKNYTVLTLANGVKTYVVFSIPTKESAKVVSFTIKEGQVYLTADVSFNLSEPNVVGTKANPVTLDTVKVIATLCNNVEVSEVNIEHKK